MRSQERHFSFSFSLFFFVALFFSTFISAQNSGGPVAGKIIDTAAIHTTGKERKVLGDNRILHFEGIDNILQVKSSGAQTDQNAVQLIQRLGGPVIQDAVGTRDLQTVFISALGERYNKVRINQLPMSSQDETTRAFPLEMIPAEAVKEVSVQTIANASLPGDFVGGVLDIQLADMPDQNFFYIRASGIFTTNTTGKPFYKDNITGPAAFGFPGKKMDLPPSFPTTRSRAGFNQKNPQEQVALSRLLPNNLAPSRESSLFPSEKMGLGIGRIIRLKHEKLIGLTAIISQNTFNESNSATVQVAPDVTNNPYPFNNPAKRVIQYQSQDNRYEQSGGLWGMFNATFHYGRNKIGLTGLLSNQFTSTFINRTMVDKPDEDSMAHSGVYFHRVQRSTVNLKLSGEHALGEEGKLKFDWQFQYTYDYRNNPDERNFLLRQDSINGSLFGIAHSGYHPFVQDINNVEANNINLINTSRKWETFSNQHFSGSFKLSAPYQLFAQTQIISGGMGISNSTGNFHSDILFVQGPGYFPLDQILSSNNYFPGGLNVTSFHANNPGSRNVYADQLGNYTTSENIGSAFIRSQNRLTAKLWLDAGIRMETSNQLVSNTQYNFVTGLRNPQLTTLDQNIYNVRFDFLPSARLGYDVSSQFNVYAALFRTINRPQSQQLTKFREYDAALSQVTMGNPVLVASNITNYEAGLNWQPKTFINIALSGFYKNIIEPIEYVMSSFTPGTMLATPVNSPTASLYGGRANLSATLFRQFDQGPPLFSVFVNTVIQHSRVKEGSVRNGVISSVGEHDLSEAPSYTVNAGLMISLKSRSQLTVGYNRIGDYTAFVGSGKAITLPKTGNQISAIPDYRVNARGQLDVRISQMLFKQRLSITAGAENILAENFTRYQDLNGNKKYDRQLVVTTGNGSWGLYRRGVDNTVMDITTRASYYLSASYNFK